MIRKYAFLFLLITAAGSVAAQNESSATTKRPDVPGTFTMEFGLNQNVGGPFGSLVFLGSRTFNIYYQYDLRIAKSRFSIVPGIGLSLERFSFKQQPTLTYINDTLRLSRPATTQLKRSKFVTNYIDVPIELRYSSKPEDPARAFKASIGGRVGYLYDAFTKVSFDDNGELHRIKDKRGWNVNRLRYGVSARVGLGNFSIYGYYNLTNLFKDGKAPYQDGTDDFNTYTVGIALSSF